MTKYILIGGYVAKAEDGGKSFAEELTKNFKEPVKILDCMFAREEETWNEKFKEDVLFFEKHLPNKKLEMKLANEANFVEQIKWADAIFIRGGKTKPLLDKLRKQNRWEKELVGKTVAGTSAGAHAIAKYYYGLDEKAEIIKGLNLLPVKVIVHYRSDYNSPNIDWDKADEIMRDCENTIELVQLREGEFKVFDKKT